MGWNFGKTLIYFSSMRRRLREILSNRHYVSYQTAIRNFQVSYQTEKVKNEFLEKVELPIRRKFFRCCLVDHFSSKVPIRRNSMYSPYHQIVTLIFSKIVWSLFFQLTSKFKKFLCELDERYEDMVFCIRHEKDRSLSGILPFLKPVPWEIFVKK